MFYYINMVVLGLLSPYMKGNIACFVVCKYFYFNFLKISFRKTIRASIRLDPDQAWHFVQPELNPNCLQKLSTGIKKEIMTVASKKR